MLTLLYGEQNIQSTLVQNVQVQKWVPNPHIYNQRDQRPWKVTFINWCALIVFLLY